nr:uncharacterized protein LOC110091217 [Pogona vitticeps]
MQAHPQKEAQRASSWLPRREPSGYSSASFYDYTSLSSSPEPTSSSGFEYSSSWEESGSSLSQSEPSSVSPASPVALSSLAHGLPSDFEYSSSPIESPSGLESGPSPGSLLRADPGDPASSLAQSSGSEGWRMGPAGVPSPGGLPNPGTRLPHSPPDPATAVGHHEGSSLTRKPLARSTGRRFSGKSSPGKDPQEETNGADPDTESDLEYPVRRVAYSPQIRLKDLRGDCSCWKDRRNSGKNIGGSLQKTHRRLAETTPGPPLA